MIQLKLLSTSGHVTLSLLKWMNMSKNKQLNAFCIILICVATLWASCSCLATI